MKKKVLYISRLVYEEIGLKLLPQEIEDFNEIYIIKPNDNIYKAISQEILLQCIEKDLVCILLVRR